MRRLAALLLLWPTLASAQTETPPAPEAAPPEPYPLAEVTLQAEETRRELERIARRLEPSPVVATVREELAAAAPMVDNAARRTSRLLATGSLSFRALNDLEREWAARERLVEGWRKRITDRSVELDRVSARLGALGARWKATAAQAKESDATAAVPWIDGALEEIGAASARVRERGEVLYALEKRLAATETQVATHLEDVRDAAAVQRTRLLHPDAPPLWTVLGSGGAAAAALQNIREELDRDAAALRSYAASRRARLAQLAGVLLATAFAAFAIRRRVERGSETEPLFAEAARAFRHPISIALLATFLTANALLPLAPRVARDLLGLMLLVPALRLLPPLVDPRFRPIVYALAVWYLALQVRGFLEPAPLTARVFFTAELTAAVAFGVWLLRPARLRTLETPWQLPRWLGSGARTLLGLLGAAFVANVFGYTSFAKILAQGVLVTAYAAFILYAAQYIVRLFVAVALRTQAARRMRIVRAGAADIERWTARIAGGLAFARWIHVSLGVFAVRDAVYGTAITVFTASLSIGNVTISVADIAAFAAVLTAAYLISRFTRFVLEQDVFPRLAVRRGIPNAVATVTQYTILFFGLVLALGAAGVELSRVTLLAGAFGVGIGFGLQNVVNNFVSGLILLFERPIQVGDFIEVHTLLGEVRRIGPRSSTIRTFDGSEVIVPNGQLISDQVVNWTLSDWRRRVTLDVGVAYGTDPERVLEILREVATEHPKVLQDPAPFIIFRGFGESSLDFSMRCWIPRYDEGLSVKSELAVAVNRSFREAGVEIPFPQRDLHLRSVDKDAAQRIRDA